MRHFLYSDAEAGSGQSFFARPAVEPPSLVNTDQGQDYYEERYREHVLRALSQRAAKLGMHMVPIAPADQPA